MSLPNTRVVAPPLPSARTKSIPPPHCPGSHHRRTSRSSWSNPPRQSPSSPPSSLPASPSVVPAPPSAAGSTSPFTCTTPLYNVHQLSPALTALPPSSASAAPSPISPPRPFDTLVALPPSPTSFSSHFLNLPHPHHSHRTRRRAL
ncbi:hypothetical protein VNO80_15912 [Phaseolus coccineus]|uniref:Uncharacterized protein n=1 Tax=Phaseolus coccineus TaxID=3886 RepID=A0AAN9MLH0_PHACN